MTHEAATQFLAQPWVAVLSVAATTRAPVAVPVWYALNAEGKPWFVTPKASLKSRLIQAEGRMTLTAQKDTRPYAYVSVEGSASLETAVFGDILEMAQRYLGEGDGAAYAERMRQALDAGSRWRVTLSPERWSTYGFGA